MKFLLALLLSLPLFSQTYTIGDSHSQACYFGKHISVVGSTYRDLEYGLNGIGPFRKKLRAMKSPSMIILAFGTNDAVDFDYDRVARSVDSVIVTLHRRYPVAHLVVWGPPSSRSPRLRHLPDMVALLKDATTAREVPFVDRTLITPNMFQHDRIHLTSAGYAKLKDNLLRLN